ncbi:endonuclease/exonuclease/phosphatase family protein [Stenotrophomonas sp. MMGLT7]|uniref:endonuclease/exonuclease/phosphatase family protein n=1 Tax=Stenotrophomonas sp. MMGLT7 TaxID=2901227 RepID=UPI001E4CEB3A|nr:endonuclease/exonuclease/phosphatase family protein [Stenotrophomonas sp. MMGLT7]MCD7099983.1 endonuclease/exonuclease/phosphatase family protein [Stenotrophomonas sp. MMGLT7]
MSTTPRLPACRPSVRLLLAALLLCATPAMAADALQVMSFNVRTPVDRDGDKRWEVRREAMVALLRERRPDVVGTQELVREQADYLVRHLPGYRWFGTGRSGDDSDEHMGVLYDPARLEVIESGDFWLSDTPDTAGSISWGNIMPRMVTWALFERRSDRRRFYLFNTHLPYRDQDEPARVRSAGLILSRLHALPAGIPVVVTGDFNTMPASPTHRAFTAQLADARESARRREGPAATFNGFGDEARNRIDWILVRGFRVERFATLADRPHGILPSDHFPVVAELHWPD